jgi:hypothetical protein
VVKATASFRNNSGCSGPAYVSVRLTRVAAKLSTHNLNSSFPEKDDVTLHIDSLNASGPVTTDAGQVRVLKGSVTWRLVRERRYGSVHSNPRQFTAIMLKSGRLRSTKNIWYPFIGGWMDSKAKSDVMTKRKIPCHLKNQPPALGRAKSFIFRQAIPIVL